MDHSLPSSSVYGILQARILEWVVIPCSRDLPDSGIKRASPALAVGFFTTEPQGSPNFLEVTTNRKYFPPAIKGNKPGVNTHLFALCLDAFLLVVVLVVKNHLPVKET